MMVDVSHLEHLERLCGRLTALVERFEKLAATPAKLLTVKETAAMCQVSEDTVYNRMTDVHVRVGNSVRICPKKLQRYLDAKPI